MKLLQTMILATAMLVATAGAGHCAFFSGSQILEECSVAEDDLAYFISRNTCVGYIEAVADVSHCGEDVLGFSWKSPEHVTAVQLVEVFTKWLNEHPEKLQYDAAGLVANALQDAFPCQ